ncbi:MAG: hypothetical protein WC596_00110 [Candidatus Shapirobacteria bacterium]
MLLLTLSLLLLSPKPVSITASIPESDATIYGYTSPSSQVELTSVNAYAKTISNNSGYFEFNRLILPRNVSDLCFSATDDNHRLSYPVCVPPPPSTNYHTNIGPLILPPTLTLDTPSAKPLSTVASSGQSLPNSTVKIHFYQASHAPNFPKSVAAFSLPSLDVTTDSLGNFSFSLPTSYATNYRLFTTVNYQSQSSPNSNTLTLFLPSLLYLFWLQNRYLIISLAFFIPTLTFFFYLIYVYYLHPKTIRYLPFLYQKELIKITP